MEILLIEILAAVYAISAAAACFFNYRLKTLGLSGIPYGECFNPLKMASVFVGYLLRSIIPDHVFEQYVIRFYDPDCRKDCLLGNDGKCVSCGCDTHSKMWSPMEKDSKSRWGKIIFSKEEYAELRKKYPVTIKITYGDGSI